MAQWAAGLTSGSSTMMTMIFLEKLGVLWMDMECATAVNAHSSCSPTSNVIYATMMKECFNGVLHND